MTTQASLPAPRIPAHVPIGKALTVGSKGSSGLRYRLYAAYDRDDSDITVVAIPMREADQTLHRLLRIEAIVIAAVLLALAATAYLVVRHGRRRIGQAGHCASVCGCGSPGTAGSKTIWLVSQFQNPTGWSVSCLGWTAGNHRLAAREISRR